MRPIFMQIELDQIEVASPCSASWEEMQGDDRVRFCGDCKLNVYDLSEMTRPEAEALVAEREGRICARFFRRADGTVLTRDCPVGLRALRLKLARRIAQAAALLVFLGLGSFAGYAVLEEATAKQWQGDIGLRGR